MSEPVQSEISAFNSSASAPWSPLARIAFRFGFAYLVMSAWFWVFAFAAQSTALLAKPYHALWRPVVQWNAVHLFHLSGPIERNFVHDTRYLYVLLATFLIVSAIAALVWTVLDRKRTQYVVLDYWLRIFIRYVLAYLLLRYGMEKIFMMQFPAPAFSRLVERFGDYSPSSLMWAFIGSSTLYSVFGGVAEVASTVLLLFRRTAMLGALVGFAVMFNVTVLDFGYDVSVKMLCLNILLMALYLLLPDACRLLNFMILNRATQPSVLDTVDYPWRVRTVMQVAKICLIGYLFVPVVIRDWKNYHTVGAGAPKPPLYGLYEVQNFTLDGVPHPALITDATRWRYVALERPNWISLKLMDESLVNYFMRYDASTSQMTVYLPGRLPGDPPIESKLQVAQPDANSLTLQGELGGTSIETKLTRIDPSGFTLVHRGFHWINENTFEK